MPIARTPYLAVIVWLALTVLPNSFALAGETITVQLASGRTFSGTPAPRSDDDRLWLRFGGLTANVLRPVKWSAIRAIHHGGEPIAKQAVLDLAAAAAHAEGTPESTSNPGSIAITIENAPTDIPYAEQAAAILEVAAPPTHLDFHATLENWDSDPEPDGLLLHVRLLSDQFEAVAASGSLQAVLFAPVERRFQAVPHARGASVLPLARWSHAVRVEDYRYGEVVLKLPFTAIGPRSTDLALSLGLLHVRMAVPGHGVFEDSRDGLQLQRFTPTRNLLERQGRSRTVSTEPPRRVYP